MKKKEPPPLVNHRWQLPSLDQMIDDLLPEWPEGKHPDFSGTDGHAKLKAGIRTFAERLMWQLSLCLEKAAGKGISEALTLIQNPDYYETVKRRRARVTKRDKEYHERQEQERERLRRYEFTEEERIRELARIAYDLRYHQKAIEQLNAHKLRVETSNPILGEVKPDDDEWSDTIFG